MGRKPVYIALLLLLTLASNSSARVWYVKPDSTGQAINIQAGIDSCTAGDTVVALQGIFRGTGNWDLDFLGKPIVVMGASRYDSTITDSTVIDGDNRHRGFYFHSGETNASILEDLIITNCGYRSGAGPDTIGGGIVCDSSSSPIIRYNRIRNCAAKLGGGIRCTGSSAPILSDNVIYANLAEQQGGGIYCHSSSPVIINNRVHNNVGWVSGMMFSGLSTGIYCGDCPSVTISNNKIYNNGGTDMVTGVWIDGSSAVIRGNEFWGNNSQGIGGLWVSSSTVTIVRNSIHDNRGRWAAIKCDASSATIDSNYVFGNIAITYEDPPCGIRISGGKAVIRNNQISSNPGGGISYGGDSIGTIENNVIVDNSSSALPPGGGGITCSGPADIVGNMIKNNVGKYWGGGIWCSSSASIRNNVIISNSSFAVGGGIFCEGPSPSIINNTIIGNKAGCGSGIYISAQSHPIVSCNIISDNRLNQTHTPSCTEAGGIYSESDSITISCSDVFNNEGGNYVGLPDQTGLNGNFSADPIFCDTLNDVYSLNSLSPCLSGNHPNGAECGLIGALGWGCGLAPPRGLTGTPLYSTLLITWNHNLESNISHYNIYKGTSEDFTPGPTNLYASLADTFFYDGQWKWMPYAYYKVTAMNSNRQESGFTLLRSEDVTGAESSEVPKVTYLAQNYPNPFNPVTRIEFGLDARANISLRIYDVGGRLIRVLAEGNRPAGKYKETWDGRDTRGMAVASGVYFYRLDAGSFMETKKMVLLR